MHYVEQLNLTHYWKHPTPLHLGESTNLTLRWLINILLLRWQVKLRCSVWFKESTCKFFDNLARLKIYWILIWFKLERDLRSFSLKSLNFSIFSPLQSSFPGSCTFLCWWFFLSLPPEIPTITYDDTSTQLSLEALDNPRQTMLNEL